MRGVARGIGDHAGGIDAMTISAQVSGSSVSFNTNSTRDETDTVQVSVNAVSFGCTLEKYQRVYPLVYYQGSGKLFTTQFTTGK